MNLMHGLENMAYMAKVKSQEERNIEKLQMLQLQFPRDKKRIAKLNLSQKIEWYGYQWQPGLVNPETVKVFGTKEFQSFWRWRVYIPMRIGRLFFRIKNLEIFKKYPHISELKEKRRKGPERI